MPTRINNAKMDRGSAIPQKNTVEAHLEKQWAIILDKLPQAISIHAMAGEIAWANQALCELYRKPLSALKGLGCSEVFHQEASSSCPHEEVLTTGQSVQIVDDLIVSGRTFSVTLEPLFDESNQQWGFMRVMHNVTGERNTREQLIRAERFATSGQLFSAIAHDVGTPLNVISGYAEFLLMRKSSEDQGYKELRSILDQTRRIAALFGQALDMARPAQGRTATIELGTLVTESLTLVGHHLRNADVTAGLTCTISKPLIYGEASQLKQALFNLLLNAGQRVGAGGRLQMVIDQPEDLPGFLRLVLIGTDVAGVEHDFSESLSGGRATRDGSEKFGIGMHLARTILEEAGVKIGAGEGLGLLIYLPTKSEY